MSGELLLILVIAVLYVALGLKFSGKNERLIIYRNGTLVRVSEQRVTFVLPFVQSVRRLYTGAREVYLPVVKLTDFPKSSLVSCKFKYRVDHPMKAAMNSDLQKATELAVQSTLIFIISSSTFEQCLKESYYLEKQAIEVVNRQTRVWGVTVSMLTLTDFRLHREILSAIEGMLTLLNFELTSLLGSESINRSTDQAPLFEHALSTAVKVHATPPIYESFAKSNLMDTNA
jgi:regulator of protease activity HflC (stomatin/prohibitin superfamily)